MKLVIHSSWRSLLAIHPSGHLFVWANPFWSPIMQTRLTFSAPNRQPSICIFQFLNSRRHWSSHWCICLQPVKTSESCSKWTCFATNPGPVFLFPLLPIFTVSLHFISLCSSQYQPQTNVIFIFCIIYTPVDTLLPFLSSNDLPDPLLFSLSLSQTISLLRNLTSRTYDLVLFCFLVSFNVNPPFGE